MYTLGNRYGKVFVYRGYQWYNNLVVHLFDYLI
jgi:hypothetical protein